MGNKKGNRWTKEQRERHGQQIRARWNDPEWRKEHRPNYIKANNDPEKVKRHSEFMRDRVVSEETCSKLGEALRGVPKSREHRLAIGRAKKRFYKEYPERRHDFCNLMEELIEQDPAISECRSRRGSQQSEKTRQKISESVRKTLSDPKVRVRRKEIAKELWATEEF